MRPAAISLVCLVAATVSALPARAAVPSAPDAKTATAVQAADTAWGAAEESGDAAFVDWLLLPEYRSVDVNGKVTEKATIFAHANAHKDPPAGAVEVAGGRRAARAAVTLSGDAAVLTWVSAKVGAEGTIYSCDIFVYRDGHWRGVYSQHTAAS